MLKAIIIDDEKKGVELMFNLLTLYCKDVIVLTTANSVKSGYDAILLHKPDIVFLDIQMQDGTGFDLLSRFNEINFKVVFVTAYQEYAIKAFQFSALDYVLKPVSPDNLINAVKKANQILNDDNNALKINALLTNINNPSKEIKKIVLKTAERIYSVNVREIIRCESDGSYTSVYLNDGKKILVSRLLKEFDELLTEYRFFRTQQSHLINLEYLDYYEKSDSIVVMKDKSSIPVASRKKDQLIKLIENIA